MVHHFVSRGLRGWVCCRSSESLSCGQKCQSDASSGSLLKRVLGFWSCESESLRDYEVKLIHRRKCRVLSKCGTPESLIGIKQIL